jgi:hypothetical protein
VTRNLAGKRVGILAQILLPPQITNPVFSLEPQIRPSNLNLCRLFAQVGKANRPGTVFHLFRPDFEPFMVTDPCGRFAQRILIDGEDFIVAQKIQGKIVGL